MRIKTLFVMICLVLFTMIRAEEVSIYNVQHPTSPSVDSPDNGLTVTTSEIITDTGLGRDTDLFFSEYIEGSSNNKALEIYNGTGAQVDLADYRIAQSVNGAGWAYYHEWSSSTILADGDVW
ncbi:MAG: lamin tail domain-containing protein, partial [Candidatus Cloacimonetes bacterium]|nr:lamin tail domain-containing protein [Candidatus Cloacimonadota bacterium]